MTMPREDSKIFTLEPVPRDTAIVSVRNISNASERNIKLNRVRKLISKGKERKDIFNRIVEPLDNTSLTYVDGLYGSLALVITFISSFPTLLIPGHNELINPNYWYKIFFTSLAGYFVWASFVAKRADAVLKSFNKSMYSIIFHLFVALKATEILATCGLHLIWSTFLGFFEPFPFRCRLVTVLVSHMTMVIRLWYLFSKEKRLDPMFRKRYWAFVCYLSWGCCILVQLAGMTKLFDKV